MQIISSAFAEIDFLQLKACSNYLKWWRFTQILKEINEKLLTISNQLSKENPYIGSRTLIEKIDSINREIENFGLTEAEKKMFWTKGNPQVIKNDLYSE
jgi:cob(I)alamin adenosyltransferase